MTGRSRFMQHIKKFRPRNFYFQLVALVAALTVAFAAVNVAVFTYMHGVLLRRGQAAQQETLSYCLDSFNTVISKIYQAVSPFIGNVRTVKSLYEYDRNIQNYEEEKTISDIISGLYYIYNSDTSIKSVFVARDDGSYVVDSSGVTSQPLYFNMHFGDEADEWQRFLAERHLFTLRMNREGSSLYIINSIYHENRKFAALCIELDINRLMDTGYFREFLNGRIVCLTDSGMNIIGYLSGERSDELVLRALHGEKLRSHLVFIGSTAANEMNLVALTPSEMVTGELTLMLTVSMIIVAAVLILGVVVSVAIAGRMYQPLRNAVELIVTAGNRGGDNEFSLIEQNLNAVLEDNRTKTEFVERSTPMLLESMFRKLIEAPDSERGLEDMAEMLAIDMREGFYMALAIYAYGETGGDMTRFFPEGVVSLFSRHRGEYVMIIYMQREAERTKVLECCERLRSATGAVVAAGKAYSGVYSIGKSYHDALSVLESRPAGIPETEVFDAVSCGERYVRYVLPGNIENMLYNYIISGNVQLVRETIDSSLGGNIARGVSFREYIELIEVYESYLSRICGELDPLVRARIAFEAPPGTDSAGETFSSEQAEARAAVMREKYLRISEFYNSETRSDIMQSILKYIDDNLERDIGLEDIASAVGLTPNYITKYFKSKNGINFKAYLTLRRIDRAKELLTRTDLSVKDIAAKCGYNSSKQLIMNFSRATGTTPSEYRKRRLNAGG